MVDSAAATALRVAVIIGSTREGRAGAAVGSWVTGVIRRHAGLDPTTVDLARFAFPARHPCEATEQIRDFTARIGTADAFVVVTPVYNHSFPASLKQAIDYAYDEWHAKPAGIVSYGYRSEGLYAMEHLRTVFGELHVVTMRSGVSIDLMDGGFDHLRHQAGAMLDQLAWWGLALRDARAVRPYVS
jgi:NAD(P)H-dependent FMN reductase